MIINEKTKISKLLKEHPEALQTIVSLSPDFKRLLNPVLRKLVGGRTSIAMASKMGKVTPQDFFDALEPLGFEIDRETKVEENSKEEIVLPEYIKSRKKEQIIEFDVRKMIAEGGDPLRPIQEKILELKAGEVLMIVADFEPVPLIRLLGNQGFTSHIQFVNENRIESYFYKEHQKEGSKNEIKIEEVSSSDDWDVVWRKFEGKMVEVDVRHLEMPEPMMTILGELDKLPEDKALYVNHKKVPVFLLSELKDRSFDYRIKDIQEGEVYLLIFKEG